MTDSVLQYVIAIHIIPWNGGWSQFRGDVAEQFINDSLFAVPYKMTHQTRDVDNQIFRRGERAALLTPRFSAR